MKFSQAQIIWIQDWLEKLEKDFESKKEELRRELYQMKKELTESDSKPKDSFMGTEC